MPSWCNVNFDRDDDLQLTFNNVTGYCFVSLSIWTYDGLAGTASSNAVDSPITSTASVGMMYMGMLDVVGSDII